jgi:hypothetical protein
VEWFANGKGYVVAEHSPGVVCQWQGRYGWHSTWEWCAKYCRLAHHLAEHLPVAKRDRERICWELATHFAKVIGDWIRK